MALIWRPTPRRMAALLALAERRELTYREVGATREPLGNAGWPRVIGYHHLEQVTAVGSGQRPFDRVADALMRWQLQRAAGLLVTASSPTVIAGSTVVNATAGMVGVLAPCQVIYVLDEPRRRGFAYGTLPGHPLRGEELFTVELSDDGMVALRIMSFSRAAGAARLVPALSRAGQRRVNRRYAAAARRLALAS